jgi:hypothetical protein
MNVCSLTVAPPEKGFGREGVGSDRDAYLSQVGPTGAPRLADRRGAPVVDDARESNWTDAGQIRSIAAESLGHLWRP